MKDSSKVLISSLAAVLSIWIVDAAVDAFIFDHGTFLDLVLLDVSAHELYSRMIIIAALAVYGIVISKIRDITERKRLEEESRTYREQLEKKVQERTEKLHLVNELLHKEILDRTRTEEELSRSETFLNTIFDSFHDPFSILDRDYKIIKSNDAYAHVKKMQPQEFSGEKCYEVFYGKDSVCEDCVVEKTFQSADPCAKEKLISGPDELDAWIEIYTYPILDKNGQVSHVIQYSRDITDRKKAEEENGRLIQNLNRLSTTDSLTGLLNRRALTDMLHREIERAQRYDSSLSVILCDIDKFKNINDAHGHAVGDEALRAVGETLKKSVRTPDAVGRYGGDEFLIILPETSLPGAEKLAEKIRSAVEEVEVNYAGKKKMRVTLSLGVAGCCGPIDDIDTLMKIADKALYDSKHLGRNRVSSAKL